jgi:hypothetical protein
MDFGFTFNVADAPESEQGEFKPITAGTRVLMHVEEAELKPTKTGLGIKLKFRVLAGEWENWPVRGFINVQNASEQAQNIGLRELASLCKAMGRENVASTEELLYQPFEATVGVKEDEQYGPQNVIKKYHAKGGDVNSRTAGHTPPCAPAVLSSCI